MTLPGMLCFAQVEGSEAYNKQLIERLHGVLRPFLLRRMKAEVEKQVGRQDTAVVRCVQ